MDISTIANIATAITLLGAQLAKHFPRDREIENLLNTSRGVAV
jgi:hypothetical protein